MASSAEARLKRLIKGLLCVPAVRKAVERFPRGSKLYSPVQRTHPIDVAYGIDTSGVVLAVDIPADKRLVPLINPYIGSQPSILRRALRSLGEVSQSTFVDLGCGKGRAAIVASEFPFREVIGVELSAALAATARKNAAVVARRFPDRPRIQIVAANLVDYELPPGNLVLFNYNAVGPALHMLVVEKLKRTLAADTPHIFFIQYNPVVVEGFDSSSVFRRYYAEQSPYDPSELGFGPDTDDAVVIWQSVRGAVPTPHERRDRGIVITKPMMRAELSA